MSRKSPASSALHVLSIFSRVKFEPSPTLINRQRSERQRLGDRQVEFRARVVDFDRQPAA